MWAIMGVAVNPKGARDWAGLVIGGTLGFAVMAIGPLTGAGLNPARSFGPSLVGGGEPVGEFLVAYVARAARRRAARRHALHGADPRARGPRAPAGATDRHAQRAEESRRDEGDIELPTGDRPAPDRPGAPRARPAGRRP